MRLNHMESHKIDLKITQIKNKMKELFQVGKLDLFQMEEHNQSPSDSLGSWHMFGIQH